MLVLRAPSISTNARVESAIQTLARGNDRCAMRTLLAATSAWEWKETPQSEASIINSSWKTPLTTILLERPAIRAPHPSVFHCGLAGCAAKQTSHKFPLAMQVFI
ncbi:hypothetical protein MRX96_010793 [Rhipicephalus microplus]